MNSPFKGRFTVTQQFKGSTHDGLDIVGLDSKNVYSTVNGVVEYAGWNLYLLFGPSNIIPECIDVAVRNGDKVV